MSDGTLRIGLIGASGRMGRALLQVLHESEGCELGAALVRPGHHAVGLDAAVLVDTPDFGVALVDAIESVVESCDVVIDFSTPGLLARLAPVCSAAGRPLVTGTTGLDDGARSALALAAEQVAVVASPNMSIGINILTHLADITSESAPGEWQVELGETHHAGKRDAPSGTALALGDVIERHRGTGSVRFQVTREGDIVGVHAIRFQGGGESLTLEHTALDRTIFARGALRAARWIHMQPPGSYGMAAVLGLKSAST